MSHVACPLCGCSVPQGRFPLEGPVDDISLLEFRGLGRRKGFEVKARRSALDDSTLCEKIALRAMEISRFLMADVPGRTSGTEAELEVLRADLSETERMNQALKRRVAAEAGQRRGRDREIKQLREAATEAERMFSSLESSARSLLASLGPVLDKCEYVAMDDPTFADDYQEAVNRVETVRSVLSEDSNEM